MAKRNTKESILLKALELFADRGYEGVSVRDIAAEVGIRQSSLYKHFAGKQDIFDTLDIGGGFRRAAHGLFVMDDPGFGHRAAPFLQRGYTSDGNILTRDCVQVVSEL